MGFKNTTPDGNNCIDWSRSIDLYKRYTSRGRNVDKNYCRNPDNDVMGPWCFIAKISIIKSQVKFKSCGIPMCTIINKNFKKTFKMGVPMLLSRNCPKGFTKDKDKYCIVDPDYLDKLPNGTYGLESLGNRNDTNCYMGFREEIITKRDNDKKKILCYKENGLKSTIEFPTYINPSYGELIFMTISITDNCPLMMSKTSTIIKKSLTDGNTKLDFCYYFYKISKMKYLEDRRLAFLTFDKTCPENSISKSMEYRWKFVLSMYKISRHRSIYACIPNRDRDDYPDGNYCLISFSSLSSTLRCPKDFIKVKIVIPGWPDRVFCCRESMNDNETHMNIYKFFNFSSVIIISNGQDCIGKDAVGSEIRISNYHFESIIYQKRFICDNCDLVKAFSYINTSITYSKISFTACQYERVLNGFAYASINSRCPPEMEYAYIKYSTIKHSLFKSLSTIAKFCTKVNYPANILFPPGRYCIYKIGFNCPKGFINSEASLPSYSFKNSDSNGHVPNYNSDSYCCKIGSNLDNFENISLPYLTSILEFGLPFPNDSYSCVHGLPLHSGVEDTHMCEYYPITTESYHTTVIFPSDRCRNPAYTFYEPYRLSYLSNSPNRYCYYYAQKNPPPGNYCIISAKNCPRKYFNYITYHPLRRGVICCRKNVKNNTQSENSSFTLSDWVNDLKEFNLLPYKGKCQFFKGYNYGKAPSKVSNGYKIKDIGIDHSKNLTDIGIRIIKATSYTVWIESCLYKIDPFNRSNTWPHGNYAFPKTLSDCPSEFKSGYFTHSMESASPSFAHSDIIHLDGDYMIGGSTIKWGFCVKKDSYKREKLHLPYGRYCLMKVGKTCPIDFKEGLVKFVEITAINNLSIQRKGDLPEIENDGPFITYRFCCRSGRGDVAHSAIHFPIDGGPFYLFKFGTYCQNVHGMKFNEEYICIDSEDSAQFINYTFQAPYKVEGFTPITGSYSRGCDFQINLCYYQKDSPTSQISLKPKETKGWPKGSYVFIKSLKEKCPELFTEGRITVHAKFKIDQKFLNTLMFGAHGDKETILSYCERNSTSLDMLYPPEEWPRGVYCVIFEKKCPQGMLRYKFKSINNIAITMLWDNLCCKKDNLTDKDDFPFFPADQYSFIILPTQEVHSCPAHKNMRVALINLQSEILCYYEKNDENVEFPDGDYLLPAPWKSQGRCSPGFKLVKHYHSSLIKNDKNSSKELIFCQKENNGSKITKFPRGNYCILTTNSSCPSNQFTKENNLVIPFYQFSGQEYKMSRYLACCQNDDHLISNLAGMKVPFQMYASVLCSYVDGMVNANEAEELTDLQQRGVVERPPYIKSSKKIRLCRYDQASVWNYDSRCQCHKNAACFLTFDDVKCRCKTGFFGDGKTICSKITTSTDRCGNVCKAERSQCVETTISNVYKCRCKEGYEGDGFSCKPSCNTRNCGVFGHCIVNSFESYCDCLPTSIQTPSNTCNGDLINTISLLSGFETLSNINFSCFSHQSYNHLINPNSTFSLFVIIPPNEEVFSKCKGISNYYGLYYRKITMDYIEGSYMINTEGNFSLLITVNKTKHWTVNHNIEAIKADIFTNAIVLYVNQSILSDYFNDEISKKFVSQDPIIAGYTFGVLIILIIIILGVVYLIRRNRLFEFNRLHDSRSETNIHFFSSDNKIEIDS